MKKNFDVIGVENLIMDLALQIDKLPSTDGMSRLKDYCWQSGGNASSAIVALARLGARCGMIGAAGNDPFGRFCREDMERHGVDVSHIKTGDGETTFCICLAEEETQGRSFLGKMGTVPAMSAEEVDESYIAQSRAIHLSSIPSDAVKDAVAYAKRNGVLISLDAGAVFPGAAELARQVDILIMSEAFYRSLFSGGGYEENCRSLLGEGPQIVIVTLGRRGCAGASAEGTFALPAFDKGYPIVDTTGAGDVFHGGFLYAYLERFGKEPYRYTVMDCACFASAVSYINCTTLGGRTGIPSLYMVDKFLNEGVLDKTEIAARKEFYKNAMFQ